MSSGTSGSDEKISASKIQPLNSEQKAGVPHDQSSRGVAGSDRNIDQTRIDPLGGQGVGQHPDPHADSQGVAGKDESIQGVKIDPLSGEIKEDARTSKNPGLDDELIDASRINPVGSVRDT